MILYLERQSSVLEEINGRRAPACYHFHKGCGFVVFYNLKFNESFYISHLSRLAVISNYNRPTCSNLISSTKTKNRKRFCQKCELHKKIFITNSKTHVYPKGCLESDGKCNKVGHI